MDFADYKIAYSWRVHKFGTKANHGWCFEDYEVGAQKIILWGFTKKCSAEKSS